MSDPLRNHRDIVAYVAKSAAAFYDHAFSDYDAEGFRKLRSKERQRWLLAFEKQLLDLTRPESMDALSRILAARVGLVVGATAPMLTRVGRTWSLWNGANPAIILTSDLRGGHNSMGRDTRIVVPGISTLTSPTDALFAALNATRPA